MTTRKVYAIDETPVIWKASGGTKLFTPTSLASGAGRQGAIHRFFPAEESAGPYIFPWRAWLKPGGTRVVDEVVQVWWKAMALAYPDNDDDTGDVVVSAQDKLNNCTLIGSIKIDQDAAVEMARGGDLILRHLHGSPIFWNATANALSSTAADFGFMVTPQALQLQTEA